MCVKYNPTKPVIVAVYTRISRKTLTSENLLSFCYRKEFEKALKSQHVSFSQETWKLLQHQLFHITLLYPNFHNFVTQIATQIYY